MCEIQSKMGEIEEKTLSKMLMTKDYDQPSASTLVDIFIAFVKVMIPDFLAEFEDVDVTDLSYDHTYKIGSFVKLLENDEQKNQFANVVFFVGSEGEIRSFTLTKTEKLEELKQAFEEIQRIPGNEPKNIYVGKQIS